jgi:uncharacterized protein
MATPDDRKDLDPAAAPERGPGLLRRDFLAQSATTALGIGGLSFSASAAETTEEPRVRRYRKLGRTGLEIADISFGASRLRDDVELVRYALDRGINYFDTAESYTNSRSETAIGRALKGSRDKFYLASKVTCQAGTKRADLEKSLDGSLARLQTDHIDVYFNHAVNEVERLDNPEWYEFAERAKKAGKIRFTGMSGHGGRLAECLEHALDENLVDVVLVAHNFGQDPAFYQRYLAGFDFVAIQPELPRLMQKAREKGVGVIAMKTLMGARLNDLRKDETAGHTFAQAAFRWVLGGPHVDALVVTMQSQDQVREYLAASGSTGPSAADTRLLGRYVALNSDSYCRFGCNACASSCPHGVPISDVLRARMYGADYGDMSLARGTYASLGAGASPCLSCAERSCLGTCPYGLDIAGLTRSAHELLSS